MRHLYILLLSLISIIATAQNLEIGKESQKIAFDGSKELIYNVNLKKNTTYLFTVFQNRIDIEVEIQDSNKKKLMSVDLADEQKGYDKLEFSPTETSQYFLIVRSVQQKIAPEGIIQINTKQFTTKEINLRDKIKKELTSENAREISTINVKHFWEAFDRLKFSKTRKDSINVIQSLYLDRATDGLKALMKVRYFEAEFFVDRIHQYQKFYHSVRPATLSTINTLDFSNLIPDFKKLYPQAKPAKIIFVIGPMSTGGTISGDNLFIGLEMLAGTKNDNISEITNLNLKADIISRNNQQEVNQFVTETVFHEYIHTQQRPIKQDACNCPLLENIIKEGVASFISEKLLMQKESYSSPAYFYAQKHEAQLWTELKSQLCTKDFSGWLYNAKTSKERPGDLGYRMGYLIAESFYNNTQDNKEAIRAMIEMDNPLRFLDESKYDLKFRK